MRKKELCESYADFLGCKQESNELRGVCVVLYVFILLFSSVLCYRVYRVCSLVIVLLFSGVLYFVGFYELLVILDVWVFLNIYL